MPESAWATFNRSRPARLTKVERLEAEISRLRAQVAQHSHRTAQLRRIEKMARHVLDFLDENDLGDWPSSMRLREALYPECPSNFTDRDDEHRLYECRLKAGHGGSHEADGATWTDALTASRSDQGVDDA